ncbi:MAG: cytochrome c biogenesis protein [Chloroflexi bacterium]|nr:cytochrome c biogenesis protein [Chloroflexota bacterium]MCL5273915.1 cytochrome c biogenesis protein [Chloroflexota bacterium]
MDQTLRQSLTTQRDAASATRALGLAAAAMIVVALVMVFAIAPRAQDAAGGDVQRIFYFHIASAWNGFGAWIVTAVAGALYLKRRDLKYDRIAVASAEIGVLFITMVLLSGMLWARPVWNTWWTWDFKLTLSALQFLMYIAYLMLRTGLDDPGRRARFAAVYGIIGALTVPLNFLVSRVLQSIHPAVIGPSVNATQQGGFGLPPDMLIIMLFCIVTFTILYIFMLRMRIGIQEQADELAVRRAELSQ